MASKMASSAHDGQDIAFKGVNVPGKLTHSRWDICCKKGFVDSITELESDGDYNYQFLIQSLCHPHIHLDKCFLLSHPKFADLEIKDGDFSEALKLTSMSLGFSNPSVQSHIFIL